LLSSTFRRETRLFNIEQTPLIGTNYSSPFEGETLHAGCSGSPNGLKRTMKLGFDIFKLLDDGSPLWIAQADSLDEATRKLEALRQSSPGHYFARDAETGQSITAEADANPGEN
jgi:hypothetical protein